MPGNPVGQDKDNHIQDTRAGPNLESVTLPTLAQLRGEIPPPESREEANAQQEDTRVRPSLSNIPPGGSCSLMSITGTQRPLTSSQSPGLQSASRLNSIAEQERRRQSSRDQIHQGPSHQSPSPQGPSHQGHSPQGLSQPSPSILNPYSMEFKKIAASQTAPVQSNNFTFNSTGGYYVTAPAPDFAHPHIPATFKEPPPLWARAGALDGIRPPKPEASDVEEQQGGLGSGKGKSKD